MQIRKLPNINKPNNTNNISTIYTTSPDHRSPQLSSRLKSLSWLILLWQTVRQNTIPVSYKAHWINKDSGSQSHCSKYLINEEYIILTQCIDTHTYTHTIIIIHIDLDDWFKDYNLRMYLLTHSHLTALGAFKQQDKLMWVLFQLVAVVHWYTDT